MKLLQTSAIMVTLCSIIALLAACKKEQALPRATQHGANTFGCYVNGKLLLPKNRLNLGGSTPALYGGYTSGANTLTLNAQNSIEEPYRVIHIILNNPIGVGEYLMSDPNNICLYEERPPDKRFSTAITGNGKVVITRDDRVNFILSGTFEFTAANTANSNEKVTVTSGRFDISYK